MIWMVFNGDYFTPLIFAPLMFWYGGGRKLEWVMINLASKGKVSYKQPRMLY